MQPMPTVGTSAESVVVVLSGRLDGTAAADARARLHRALDEEAPYGSPLVVDLSEVYLVDATGIGVLAGALHRAELLGRELVLRGVAPGLIRLFCRAGLWRVLHTHHSIPV